MPANETTFKTLRQQGPIAQAPRAEGPTCDEGVTTDEIQSLSLTVLSSSSPSAVGLACLIQLSNSAFSALSARAGGTDLAPMLLLQSRCIQAFQRETGISNADVHNATEALQRAGRSAQYLDSLPQ